MGSVFDMVMNPGGLGHSDFFSTAMRAASDDVHEAMAQEVAAVAVEEGLGSADSISIQAQSDAAELPIDVERVRRRANEILGA